MSFYSYRNRTLEIYVKDRIKILQCQNQSKDDRLESQIINVFNI